MTPSPAAWASARAAPADGSSRFHVACTAVEAADLERAQDESA
jgi:hypothetical protein